MQKVEVEGAWPPCPLRNIIKWFDTKTNEIPCRWTFFYLIDCKNKSKMNLLTKKSTLRILMYKLMVQCHCVIVTLIMWFFLIAYYLFKRKSMQWKRKSFKIALKLNIQVLSFIEKSMLPYTGKLTVWTNFPGIFFFRVHVYWFYNRIHNFTLALHTLFLFHW